MYNLFFCLNTNTKILILLICFRCTSSTSHILSAAAFLPAQLRGLLPGSSALGHNRDLRHHIASFTEPELPQETKLTIQNPRWSTERRWNERERNRNGMQRRMRQTRGKQESATWQQMLLQITDLENIKQGTIQNS